MRSIYDKNTERITNLKSLLANFQEDREISGNNDEKYLKKKKKINSLG